MFSWIFGSSDETIEAPSEKVDQIMEEAHIVKDFYNRFYFSQFVLCIEWHRVALINVGHQA